MYIAITIGMHQKTPVCGTVSFNDFLPTRNHTCTAPSAYIASAYYPLPYKENGDWFWHITTSPSTYIEVKFEEFDIESSTKDCEEDYLEFQMRSSILRVCNTGKNSFNSSFLSDQNNLTIKLHSGRSSFGGRFLAIYSERKFVQNVALQQNVSCRVQNGRRHCYCLFNYHQALTWQNASQGCKSCGDGSYLAVIQSQQDMDILQQFILHEGDPNQSAYIGLKWNDDSQRFVWVTGQPTSFTDWKVPRIIEDRQPDGGGEEKCSMITLWSFRETKNWMDIPCDDKFTSQFICQQPVEETADFFPITYTSGATEDNCREDQTRCSSGECIFTIYLCDGISDCSDQNDEVNCPNVEDGKCPPYHFACESGGCVHSTFYCDYFRHCADGSDERYCDYPSCTVNEFRCGDHRCILQSQVCDLVKDCSDGSDEKNCEVSKVYLQCSSGRMYPAHNKCDGYKDCPGKPSEDEPEHCGNKKLTKLK
ncbi:Sortilin-related receptor [Holothuria leucospilota]|uniref:Sortilin-related receptor n=1 Tax=Holothuria leucospilota TaxID=206669 RepID=A0A9Q1HFT0_HOLLE|nr:Sortilin-related receptor [Holothuria leucospilota]